jgi:hypothetical protein
MTTVARADAARWHQAALPRSAIPCSRIASNFSKRMVACRAASNAGVF